jgi:sigma-B regulation protein RsbU (phosphoserine phosphatase)
VGGDYYDIIDFKDRVAFAMADVAGKGVPAALVMVMIRSSMRTMVKTDSEPKQVATAINRALHGEVSEERYATLFYCMFDIHTGLLSYSNGGHAPMLVYRGMTDSFELLDTDGLPVGIAPETVYGQDETVLNSGDIAVLYTDGISEAMNLKHEEYSLARVKEDVRRFKDLSASEIAGRILQNISEFAGDEPQHDDETILVLKIR